MVPMRLFCGALALAIAACASDPPMVGAGCTFHGGGCDEGLVCFAVYPGGYCSQACATVGSTAECPAGSVCGKLCPEGLNCGNVLANTLACLKVCKTEEDCRLDLECASVRDMDKKVCAYPKPVVQ